MEYKYSDLAGLAKARVALMAHGLEPLILGIVSNIRIFLERWKNVHFAQSLLVSYRVWIVTKPNSRFDRDAYFCTIK